MTTTNTNWLLPEFYNSVAFLFLIHMLFLKKMNKWINEYCLKKYIYKQIFKNNIWSKKNSLKKPFRHSIVFHILNLLKCMYFHWDYFKSLLRLKKSFLFSNHTFTDFSERSKDIFTIFKNQLSSELILSKSMFRIFQAIPIPRSITKLRIRAIDVLKLLYRSKCLD